MPISSSITNQYVPPFRIDNLSQDDILIYSNVYGAFINTHANALPLSIGGSSILDHSIAKNHLSAVGGTTGNVLTVDPSGNLKWVALTHTDPSTIRIGELLDVNVLGQVTGSILQYDGSKWAIGVHALNGLSDVTVTSPVNNQTMFFDSMIDQWVNRSITVQDLADVDTTDVATGDVMYWNGIGWTVASIGEVGGIAFDDLSDVDTSTLSTGDVIYWNGTAWIPGSITDIGIALEGLNDVSVNNVQDGHVLKWNGTIWVNASISYTDITGKPNLDIYTKSADLANVAFTGGYNDLVGAPTLFSGDYHDLTNLPSHAAAVHLHTMADITDISSLNIPSKLSELDDVDTSIIGDGDVLKWDAGVFKWKPATINPLSLTDLTDVELASSAANEFLKYNGVRWLNDKIHPVDVVGLSAEILSHNNQYEFKLLTDVGTPVDGFLKWSSGSMVYSPSITSSDITGLSMLATTGLWVDIGGKPAVFPAAGHTHGMSDLTGFQIVGAPANAQSILYNSTSSKWENRLIQFTDIVMPVGTDKQVLGWDVATSKWAPKQLSLKDLSNTVISGEATSHVLKYDGTKWTNTYLTYSDIFGIPPAPASHTHPATQITGLNPVIVSANGLLSFANLADSGTKANGYMKWSTSQVDYHSTIPVTDIVGLKPLATSANWNDIENKPIAYPAEVHAHTLLGLSDTVSTPTSNNWLRWNADGTMIHYVTIGADDIYGLALVAQTGAYEDLNNIPNFANIAYSGNWSDLNDIHIDWADIQNKPSAYQSTAHSHAISNIIGLQTELDTKLESDVTTLPNLTIEYSQVNNKPPMPVNADFSFVGLSDTANIISTARVNKYLKWSSNGAEIQYVPSIPASDVSGLDNVISSWFTQNNPIDDNALSFLELNDTDNTPVNNGWLRWNATGNAIRYVPSILATDVAGLAPVATSGSYNSLTNKPTLFNGSYANLTGVPTEFTPHHHTHVINDISDFNISVGLTDLNDVQINEALLQEGHTLYWNDNTQKWNAKASSKIVHMDDVSDISVADGYLRWDTQGKHIIFQKNISADNIAGLSAVAIDGALDKLNDVEITDVVAGETLVYNGVIWINQPAGVGSAVNDSVGSLLDTTIGTLSNGDVLQWNGSKWVNSAISTGSTPTKISNDDATPNTSYIETNGGNIDIVSAGILEITGTNGISLTATSGNVTIEGIKFPNNTLAGDNGKILEYSHATGAMVWVNKPTAGVTTFVGLSDTPATYTANALLKVNSAGTGLVYDTNAYSPTTHDHGSTYALSAHNHAGTYAPVAHDHAGTYAPAAHDHAGTYAPVAHTHAGTYAPVAHTHTAAEITDLPVIPTISSGTWTPNMVSGSGVSGADLRPCTYTRIGNIVTFAGSIHLYPSGSTTMHLSLSLPIGSDFTVAHDASGVLSAAIMMDHGRIRDTSTGALYANTSSNRLQITAITEYYDGTYYDRDYFFSGQYIIK